MKIIDCTEHRPINDYLVQKNRYLSMKRMDKEKQVCNVPPSRRLIKTRDKNQGDVSASESLCFYGEVLSMTTLGGTPLIVMSYYTSIFS
jgi:hypothetical protein